MFFPYKTGNDITVLFFLATFFFEKLPNYT